ncbi:hypothetical protein PBCV1_a216R [Paramecium bursaria Chlorella virus 1]|uniref:Uncharacterized protein n=1 Tax=Paramecium bursaria Chlorella virus 1 TaxID=10506 RepID=Q84536_PBCV1|nr:hypothetical protein PBCV1_a216R [Paramecium bursaria Chlorella virus 1]AAC96584.1 hypothetical protein [Paramecium bursaria Chlorella virus 1]
MAFLLRPSGTAEKLNPPTPGFALVPEFLSYTALTTRLPSNVVTALFFMFTPSTFQEPPPFVNKFKSNVLITFVFFVAGGDFGAVLGAGFGAGFWEGFIFSYWSSNLF